VFNLAVVQLEHKIVAFDVNDLGVLHLGLQGRIAAADCSGGCVLRPGAGNSNAECERAES
jgi:hypothetical protein